MREQGQATASEQPPIRVAKSNPPLGSSTSNGGGHPSVRPANSATKAEAAPAVKQAPVAVEDSAPQVTLFDPSEQEAGQEKGDFDTPAFLRRRRSLFE